MKLTGNILQVKNKQDSQRKDIEIHIDQITYITHKKDGRYYQPFEFVKTLEEPILITGDCLARSENKNAEEGELEFKVFDKSGDEYELNPNKLLFITTVYDFEAGETILTNITYTVTLTNEEFKLIKGQKPAEKLSRKGKGSDKK